MAGDGDAWTHVEREVCMTEVDLERFSDLLKQTFPRVRFMEGIKSDDPERPPTVTFRNSLAGLDPDNRGNGYVILPPPYWEPTLEWQEPDHGFKFGYWRFMDLDIPRVYVVRGSGPTFGMITYGGKRLPPHVETSRFSNSYLRIDDERRRFKNKVWRLMGKIATCKLQHIWWPNMERDRRVSGLSIWAGHDAIRWAREDPARVLFIQGSLMPDMWAIIPAD